VGQHRSSIIRVEGEEGNLKITKVIAFDQGIQQTPMQEKEKRKRRSRNQLLHGNLKKEKRGKQLLYITRAGVNQWDGQKRRRGPQGVVVAKARYTKETGLHKKNMHCSGWGQSEGKIRRPARFRAVHSA